MPVTFAELEQTARAKVAAVRDSPQGRYELRRQFYEEFAGRWPNIPSDGSSELAFLRWEIARGVLNPLDHPRCPGSPWWRAVNEDLLYAATLAGLIHDSAFAFADTVSAPVAFWLRYLKEQTSVAWYRAHNAAIVTGYLHRTQEALQENLSEQVFVNIVLYRVLYAQTLVESNTQTLLGKLERILGSPRLSGVDFIVHLPDFYPQHYPLTSDDIDHILEKGHSLEEEGVVILDHCIIIPELAKLYDFAADCLDIPQLRSLLSDGKPVYPVLAMSQVT